MLGKVLFSHSNEARASINNTADSPFTGCSDKSSGSMLRGQTPPPTKASGGLPAIPTASACKRWLSGCADWLAATQDIEVHPYLLLMAGDGEPGRDQNGQSDVSPE